MVSGMNTFGEKVTRRPWAVSRTERALCIRSSSWTVGSTVTAGAISSGTLPPAGDSAGSTGRYGRYHGLWDRRHPALQRERVVGGRQLHVAGGDDRAPVHVEAERPVTLHVKGEVVPVGHLHGDRYGNAPDRSRH